MEDLAGLNFSSPSSSTTSSSQPKSAPPNQTRFHPQSTSSANYISPIPSRGTSANYSILASHSNGTTSNASIPRSSSTSKPDSFASLSAFSGISGQRQGQHNATTTLEQQRLAKERERRENLEKQKRDLDVHFGANEFWEKHSRTNTPTITTTDTSGDVDLSGFGSDAPVNTASHFPPPQMSDSFDSGVQDPFDMSSFADSLSSSSRARYHTSPGHLETTNSTDDILGILAQPVETFQKPKSLSPKPTPPPPPATQESSDEEDVEPRDKAIAAIVEMGFSVGQATKALSQTATGLDVQAALDNLLSRPSSSASTHLERPPPGKRPTPDPLSTRQQRHTPDPHTRRDHPSQQPEKDISQIAGELGSSFLKGAGSLWKSGREKMNTLIQEYQGSEPAAHDPNVPKWMREQQRYATPAQRKAHDNVTDEARALEARDEARRSQRTVEHGSPSRPTSARDRVTIRKQAEEEAEMGYRSSARHRIPSRTGTPSQQPPSRTATPPTPAIQNAPPTEIDLFSSSIPSSARPSRTQTPQLPTPKPATPKPTRPIPPTSDAALQSSHTSRQKGSEAFKLGDYTSALTHYTSAISPLPTTHPQRIILLSNRAITNLKLGDAKAAITDCDDLLSLVGPGRGEGETVPDIDGPKNLRDIWGKGILRRATGLETLEKYSDALEMWKLAIDAGIGGPQSLEGRRRCESALGIKPAPPSSGISTPRQMGTPRSSTPAAVHRPSLKPAATAQQKGPSATESLAKFNASAAADEDERLRLYDTVEEKVSAWQNGKESNLRALLSSLDLILWPEAGWKKIGMAELVVVNKVKIVYQKAIAKVHPDKISTGSSVEQRMIAAAVFARLNGAWATFKEQNGL